MATAKQVTDFIAKVAPIVQKVAKKNGYNFPSAIISQACLESAWGTSTLSSKYHNYFGMKCGSSWKGKSVNMATKEEYKKGEITNISANFRVYDSLEEGIQGYFDFINRDRYANLKKATSYKDYFEKLVADGYATDKSYVEKNCTVVEKHSLTQYDPDAPAKTAKSGYTKKSFIEDAKAALGAKNKTECLSLAPTISAGKNTTHKLVLPLQKYLANLGYYSGELDGEFGAKTKTAVKQYQEKVVKATGGNIDGILTHQGATYKKLFS